MAEPLKIEIKVKPRASLDEVVGMRDSTGPETLKRLDPEATG
jgi:hypothetical protein